VSGTARKVPADSSAATASELSTAGPDPVPQAELGLEQSHPGTGGGLGDAVLGGRAADAARARHAEQQVKPG
jgi:hypothetical protein